jgi:hypothetical protein
VKWLILLVGVVVVCFVVALVLGLAGGGLGRASASLSHEPLPEEPLRDSDFDDLVFDVAARGYRMSQVDGVVDRLRRELREKDEEIAVLRGEPPLEEQRSSGATVVEEADEADEADEAEAREAPGISDVRDAPDTPETRETSDVTETSETSDLSQTSEPAVGRERPA